MDDLSFLEPADGVGLYALAVDHPAWFAMEDGQQRVFEMPLGRRVCIRIRPGASWRYWGARDDVDSLLGVFGLPTGLPSQVPDLAIRLAELHVVARFRNSELWNAIATSIIRQVIRADQARKLYRRFCDSFGEQVAMPDGSLYSLLPSPTAVLALSDGSFGDIGMAFKARPLRHAAAAFSERGEEWSRLKPSELIDQLAGVRGVGDWTARATVADWSNDWSFYPYGDLAVRKWASQAAPSFDWPSDALEFSRLWESLGGAHLSQLTLMTLALGSRVDCSAQECLCLSAPKAS
jgi:DNA-3-methyladenine glycosylase II